MEVRAARKVPIFDRLGGQPVKNQVCRYWLAGRCTKNPCRFMHRESPPPQTEQPPNLAPPNEIRHKQPRKWTWRNPNYYLPKMGSIPSNEGDMFNSTSDQSTLGKVLANIRESGHTDQEMAIASTGNDSGAQAQPKVLTAVSAGPEKSSVREAHPKQCKYWVTDNCDHGDKCNEGGMFNSTSDQSTLGKVLVNTGKSGHTDQEMAIASIASDGTTQAQPKVLTAVRAGPEKSSVQKAQPMQCKYWVTGNCVHGDKCKDLHSWFSGSGFTMLAKLEGHTKAITGISLPSGCDKLYSSGKDGSIRAWDCNSGQCAGSVMMDGEVGCLVDEGPWLFAGLQNAVKAWNLQNHVEFSLSGPAGLVCSIVMDNDQLFAGIEDGFILLWKWHPGTDIPEPAALLEGHNGAVCSLVVGAANRLYSGSRDCTIKVWDRQNLQCLQTLYGHTRDVMSVLCWDRYLLSASLDNTLKVWAATESGAIEVVYEIKEEYGVIALCGIHDAEVQPILLCSFNDKTVRLYDLPSFTERGRIFSKRGVQIIQIGIDGLFFTGDATGEVSVWKLLGVPCASAS